MFKGPLNQWWQRQTEGRNSLPSPELKLWKVTNYILWIKSESATFDYDICNSTWKTLLILSHFRSVSGATMNKTESALIKQIGKSVEELVNFHNVPIVVGFLPGKQLRTMGSEHLREVII